MFYVVILGSNAGVSNKKKGARGGRDIKKALENVTGKKKHQRPLFASFVCLCRLQDEITQREDAENNMQTFRQVQYGSRGKIMTFHPADVRQISASAPCFKRGTVRVDRRRH